MVADEAVGGDVVWGVQGENTWKIRIMSSEESGSMVFDAGIIALDVGNWVAKASHCRGLGHHGVAPDMNRNWRLSNPC